MVVVVVSISTILSRMRLGWKLEYRQPRDRDLAADVGTVTVI